MSFCYDVFVSFFFGKICDSEMQKVGAIYQEKQTVLNLLLYKYFFSRVVLMFDPKNLRNLGTSNFIHGILAARKASQSSFPTIAALDFFGFVAKQSSSCAWVTFLFRFN